MRARFGRLQMGNVAGPAGCEGAGANVFGRRGGRWDDGWDGGGSGG